MKSYQASLKRRIAAPAPLAYSIIADYRDGHQRIIPPKVFQNLIVEEGEPAKARRSGTTSGCPEGCYMGGRASPSRRLGACSRRWMSTTGR